MVGKPILRYFLDIMLSSSFFTFKLGIGNLYNTLKIIQSLFYLSNLQVFISNAILRGGAEFQTAINQITVDFGSSSLIPTTTIFALPTHLRPPHPSSPPTTHKQPGRCPSPPLRDVGPLANAPSKHRSWQPSRTRPSPFQRDVGGVSSLDGGPWEGIT